MLDNLKIHLF